MDSEGGGGHFPILDKRPQYKLNNSFGDRWACHLNFLLEKCLKFNEKLQILKIFACGRQFSCLGYFLAFLVLKSLSGALNYISFSKNLPVALPLNATRDSAPGHTKFLCPPTCLWKIFSCPCREKKFPYKYLKIVVNLTIFGQFWGLERYFSNKLAHFPLVFQFYPYLGCPGLRFTEVCTRVIRFQGYTLPGLHVYQGYTVASVTGLPGLHVTSVTRLPGLQVINVTCHQGYTVTRVTSYKCYLLPRLNGYQG